MKRLLLSLLPAGVFMALSCNDAGDKPGDVESIIQDSSKYTTIEWMDTSVNFGSRKMGDIVNITFTCKNTGNKPLYLYKVSPGCGCTLADYTKEPIMPGKEGKIDARFDTKKSHVGEVHKVVYVRANNSNRGPLNLQFSGVIIPADSSKTANN
jgi:hypothetical protein